MLFVVWSKHLFRPVSTGRWVARVGDRGGWCGLRIAPPRYWPALSAWYFSCHTGLTSASVTLPPPHHCATPSDSNQENSSTFHGSVKLHIYVPYLIIWYIFAVECLTKILITTDTSNSIHPFTAASIRTCFLQFRMYTCRITHVIRSFVNWKIFTH